MGLTIHELILSGETLTGPVTTFRDLVVHVPVSSGSTCAAPKETMTALHRSSRFGDNIMDRRRGVLCR